MTVHRSRQFVRALRRSQTTSDPSRYTRGVVVSSTGGQTIVTLDGSATQVAAFNLSHTTSLAVGTVVRVLVIGDQIEILGAYLAVRTASDKPPS